MGTFAIGISGASGAIYGYTLLKYLVEEGHKIYFTMSKDAQAILKEEVNVRWEGDERDINKTLRDQFGRETIQYFSEKNFHAPIASGSVITNGMAVVPCSMKTVSAVRHGLTTNLIERAADVTLKERRSLILVPRETPLNEIHLANLYELARMGVRVIPAMPGFYNKPKTIEDMVNFIVGRVLDAMGVKHSIYKRWDEVEIHHSD